ncbi:MAG: hypothetical protein QOJ13_3492 [Gaiellales bacterium]|jgi:uncharacterized protein YndB with AHSA1/START domain|nr:hypothetical protein [Gaiellales bacterium]
MTREIRLEVRVPGTREEVWEAIASGPGITAWFVPATVEGRADGEITMDFGSGMVERGRVTAYEPPKRFVYESGSQDGATLVHEWLVDAGTDGACTVRLVNSGFGEGDSWDDRYFGMEAGWRLFLENLRLFRAHFPDMRCASVIVNAVAAGGRENAFAAYLEGLGLEGDEHVRTTTGPVLEGRVVGRFPGMLTVLTETPHPGIVFLASEGRGDRQFVSFYGYFFGEGAEHAAARARSEWEQWLHERFSPLPM